MGLIQLTQNLVMLFFFHIEVVHGSGHNISPNNRAVVLSQLNTFNNVPNKWSQILENSIF